MSVINAVKRATICFLSSDVVNRAPEGATRTLWRMDVSWTAVCRVMYADCGLSRWYRASCSQRRRKSKNSSHWNLISSIGIDSVCGGSIVRGSGLGEISEEAEEVEYGGDGIERGFFLGVKWVSVARDADETGECWS